MSRILCAALCGLVALLGLVAIPVAQATDDVPAGVDVALPVHHRVPNLLLATSGASADYALYDVGDSSGTRLDLVRLSDGQLIRTVERASGQPRPVLVDDVVVRKTSDQLVYEDIQGAVIRTLPRAGVFHADDEWTMTVADGAVTVTRFDGPPTTVTLPGLATDGTSPLWWIGGDSDRVILTDHTHSWAVDLDAATVVDLVDPDGTPVRVTDAAMAPTPVAYSYDPGHWIMQWSDPFHDAVANRYPSPADDITFTGVVGGGLVAFDAQPATKPDGYEARPIDLASATLGAPIATDVSFDRYDIQTGDDQADGALTSGGTLPDGGLVVGRSDVPGGSLARLEPDGVHTIGGLAPVDDPVLGLWRSGTAVVGVFPDGPSTRSRVATHQDGEPGWTESSLRALFIDQVGGDLAASANTLYGLDGWSRDVGASFTLSGNGHYIVVGTDVEDARTGTVVLRPGASGVFDGDTFYTQPDATGQVAVTDLTGATPPRTLALPSPCAGSSVRLLQVRARWAVASCSTGAYVVDLTDRVASWAVPSGRVVGLGSTFLVWTSPAGTTPSGNQLATPHVTALRAGHETRDYAVTGDAEDFLRTDSIGDHDPVELGLDGRIHALDVSWARAPDTVAPTVTAAGSDRFAQTVAATHVDYVATASDATDEPGDVALEVQARRSVAGAAFSSWAPVTAESGAVSAYERPGEQLCFRARATDASGNTSGWQGTRCYVVPVDDARLTSAGDVVRARDGRYLGATVSRLVGTRPTLQAPGRGSALILALAHGKGRGVLRVLVNGTAVATVGTGSGSGVQDDVVTGIPAGAVVRLAASGPRPVLLDAVARLR